MQGCALTPLMRGILQICVTALLRGLSQTILARTGVGKLLAILRFAGTVTWNLAWQHGVCRSLEILAVADLVSRRPYKPFRLIIHDKEVYTDPFRLHVSSCNARLAQSMSDCQTTMNARGHVSCLSQRTRGSARVGM